LFDNTQLSLGGSPASNELVPVGMVNLTSAVVSESQAPGRVYTFEAATLPNGPANTNFTIGTITFTATALVNDALPDIKLGFFNSGVDGLYDNFGNPVIPIFNNGFLTPAPTLQVALTSTNTVLIAWSTGFNSSNTPLSTQQIGIVYQTQP